MVHNVAKVHKCNVCDKLFHRRCNPRIYMLSHNWSTVKCKTCDMGFKIKMNLYTHIRTQHTAEEPVRCRSCNKEFKNKIYLSKHFRSLHSWEFAGKGDFTYTIKRNIDTREISYTCNGCDRSFNTLPSLMLHKHSSDSTLETAKNAVNYFIVQTIFKNISKYVLMKNLMRVFSVESRCLWRKICAVTTLLFILERNFTNVHLLRRSI